MKIQTELPMWAQAATKRLVNRGRLTGLVLCALDKDCNLVHYAIGEGVDIIVDKLKNEIAPAANEGTNNEAGEVTE